MAFTATMIGQVQAGGSDTQCGGGFNAARGGTDYSQQNTAQATGTVTSATTTVTATTAIFTAAMVGNVITDGFTYKEITAFTSSTIITVDSAPTWTAATIFVGGALASPGKATSIFQVAGNLVAIQYSASVYGIVTASTNVIGGCMAPASGVSIFGYNTTRSQFNTDALLPTIQVNSGISAATILGTNAFQISCCILDGNLQTTSRCLGSGAGFLVSCVCKNFTAGVTGGSGSGQLWGCLITGCTTTVAVSVPAFYCEATANTVAPFGAANMYACNAWGNTGATTDGFLTTLSCQWVNCNSAGNGRDGFRANANSITVLIINGIGESNSGFGFNASAATAHISLINCGSFGNTSGRSTTSGIAIPDVNPITGSSSFFTSAGTGVLTLNTTAGAGALCRAAGYPATFPAGLSTNFRDVGAVQHQDPPSGGGFSGGDSGLIIQAKQIMCY